MSKFGWSYPAGAANDPFAPYNQTDDVPDWDGSEPVPPGGTLEEADETIDVFDQVVAERDALRAEVNDFAKRVVEQDNEIVRLRAALKVHHDLGAWSLGHEICPECGQACRHD